MEDRQAQVIEDFIKKAAVGEVTLILNDLLFVTTRQDLEANDRLCSAICEYFESHKHLLPLDETDVQV